MIFEIARAFPAFKPHEVAALPTRYYLKMRTYLIEIRDRERRALDDPAGSEIVDWDKGERPSSSL